MTGPTNHGNHDQHFNFSADAVQKDASGMMSETLNNILDKVLQMSWHVRAKHGIVSGLMTYVPVCYLLQREPQLGACLLDCLSTNFLAPSGTQVFTAILKNTKLADDIEIRDEILSWVDKGLMSDNSLQKHNVNHLWLPACIKFAPQLFQYLLKQTQASLVCADSDRNKDAQLYMLTCLLKSARMYQLKLELPVEMLRNVLHHVDDDLRLDGFALTCVTPKKSEPLSEAEIDLLRSSLPYNMNNDNAPFRQQIQSHLRTVLVRARDSVLAVLKLSKPKTKSDEKLVDQTLGFLDWFWRLCIDNLHPGASYQRLKTSLDWIAVILDTLTHQPGKNQKKGNTPQNVTKLLEFAQRQQRLMFHTENVARSILSCLLHGTDEIRECAGDILHTYMPWPLPVEEDPGKSDLSSNTCHLLESALNLCDNPKAYESEAGVLLVKLIFSRLVIDKGESYEITRTASGKHSVKPFQLPAQDTSPKLSVLKDNSSTLRFVSQLVALLRNSCDVAKCLDVIQAATSCPGHGLVLTIQRCLTECDVQFTPISKESTTFYGKLLKFEHFRFKQSLNTCVKIEAFP